MTNKKKKDSALSSYGQLGEIRIYFKKICLPVT